MADNNTDKYISDIKRLVEDTEKNLEKIRNMLKTLESESRKDLYRDVEGITGVFDGNGITTESGQTHEVPANYAAKSRLVFGDTLKLIEENGKQVFKLIEKVERKKIEGILTKKEGKWYILSDAGSYKISDNAAEFNKAKLNDEAVALIPSNNTSVPYAALDLIKKKKQDQNQPQVKNTPRPVQAPQPVATPKPDNKPVEKAPSKDNKRNPKPNKRPAPKPSPGKPERTTSRPVKPAPTPKPKEFVEDIIGLDEGKKGELKLQPNTSKELEDDDLR